MLRDAAAARYQDELAEKASAPKVANRVATPQVGAQVARVMAGHPKPRLQAEVLRKPEPMPVPVNPGIVFVKRDSTGVMAPWETPADDLGDSMKRK